MWKHRPLILSFNPLQSTEEANSQEEEEEEEGNVKHIGTHDSMTIGKSVEMSSDMDLVLSIMTVSLHHRIISTQCVLHFISMIKLDNLIT